MPRTSGMDTVFASELSLSGSCLDEMLVDDHSEVDLPWTFRGVVSRWDSRGAFSSYK